MPEWEHKVEVARGPLWRGPIRAQLIQETLMREQSGGWELVSAVPVTQLGFTSGVWLLFRRPAWPTDPPPSAAAS